MAGTGRYLRFAPASDPPGLTVSDDIERREVRFTTPEPVSPRATATDRFRYPVDAACLVETTELSLDRRDEVFVREGDGPPVGYVRSHDRETFPAGTYSIEISGPVKLYLRLTGEPTVAAGPDYVRVSFAAPTEVAVGARSYHQRPAGTVTTTEDPEDIARALSVLPSALKTLSPERSYPTLRGHPPLVDLGDDLSIPDGLEPPETGVRVVVPADLRALLPVAPLAFYLGARVETGYPPRIVTESGFEYPLAGDGWFGDSVARTLKQVFFLDCVVRTEGFYRADLQERRLVESDLPFDPADCYDAPLDRRLAAYLRVPHDVVKPALPRWCLTAHLPARADAVAAIPHVVNDLGVVRIARGREVAGPDATPGPRGTPGGDGPYRPAGVTPLAGTPDPDGTRFVVPDDTDESVVHAWFGPHLPIGATKGVVAAYENRLDQSAPSNPIDITVVCNDASLTAEQGALDTVYGYRDELPYDVHSYTDLTTDQMAVLLGGETDFLHFIGDRTDEGLVCSDGTLDTRTLTDVGVEVFLLNASRSSDQALGLVEGGAVGGLATLGSVRSDDAVAIGRGLAHLLNLGFPLQPAVSLVRDHARSGDRYLVVGDGMADIAQAGTGVPIVCDITSQEDGQYRVSVEFYPTRGVRIGSLGRPLIEGVDRQYLIPGRTKQSYTLSETELREYLEYHSYPLRVNGTLRWNRSFDLGESNDS